MNLQENIPAPIPQTVASSAMNSDFDAEPPKYDGWEIDEQLRHIQRTLRGGGAKLALSVDSGGATTRVDPAQAVLPSRHGAISEAPPEQRHATAARPQSFVAAFLTWLLLAVGIVGSVCGGVLSGWSLLAGRPELWTIGMPTMFLGQIVLWVGLALQFERVWHDNRAARRKLAAMDRKLHEMSNRLVGSR